MCATGWQENRISTQTDHTQRGDNRSGKGILRVVGFGPGGKPDRTRRAEDAILASDTVIGYGPYLERIDDLLEGKQTLASGMRQERSRVEAALELASEGEAVALVSSGDSGIYGMAGLALEMAQKYRPFPQIEIIPGVTSAIAAAAKVGAPLMLDYATISLSDLLVPLDQIEKRLRGALEGDFVITLYNPKSKTRTEPFKLACKLLNEYRSNDTPVALGHALGSDTEYMELIRLGQIENSTIDMKTVIIIGNSQTVTIDGWMINPRGYSVK